MLGYKPKKLLLVIPRRKSKGILNNCSAVEDMYWSKDGTSLLGKALNWVKIC
jgi:hypothetical protein